ncbi:hypothetical protein Tco_1432318, partial [Tanacetum coccineum]
NDIDMSMQVEDATDTAVITTDSVAEVIENDNTVTLTFENVKMTNVEMVTDQQNPGESEVQSMVDVPVTQATPAVLRHPPIESIVTLSPDTTIIPSSLPPLTQPIQELLFRMMDKAKTLKRHPKHKALYDALVASLIVDEDDIDIVFDTDEGILDIETNAEDIGHNSTLSAPVTNKPNWFKESPLPETLDSPILKSFLFSFVLKASHFFNKDIEYLRTGNLEEKKYLALTTNTRAIKYELYGVEEMVENLWSKSLVAYDKDAAYEISHWGYKRKVEDHQLGVESYQTKLNLIKPQVLAPGVNGQKPFTIFYKPKGVIYESRSGNSCLMREDKMCKFGDATLVTVRDGLKTHLTNITVSYDGDTLSRSWSKSDCKHAKSMVKVIEKTLHRM